MFNNIIIWRRRILIVSQLLGGGLCLYFIVNVRNYEVSWNVLNWLMPTVANKINYLLRSTGTTILIIPLTIIIVSFLFPANIPLKIISAFWGVASTLMVLISGILKGNSITNVYDMRMFLITKILSIEEKRVIFKMEIDKIMSMPIINDKYKNNLNLYQYVSDHSTEKALLTYDTQLSLLRETQAIKLYADDVVFSLVEKFTQISEITNVKHDMILVKYIAYAAVVILVLFCGVSIIRWFLEDDKLFKGFSLAKETANLGAQTNLGQTELAQISAQVVEIIRNEIPAMSVIPANLVNNAVKDAFLKVTHDITIINNRLTEIDKALLDVTSAVITTHNKS